MRYVLEGSVRKAGNRVRITGQLIDAATGAHLWADRFDGELEDVFDLQDQVTASVVGAIEPKLRAGRDRARQRKPTESLDAYDLLSARHGARSTSSITPPTERRWPASSAPSSSIPASPPRYGMAARCYAQRKGFGWIADPVERMRGSPPAGAETRRKRAATTRWRSRPPASPWSCSARWSTATRTSTGRWSSTQPGRGLAHRRLRQGLLPASPTLAIERADNAMRLSPQDSQKFAMQAVVALGQYPRRPLRRGARLGQGRTCGKWRIFRSASAVAAASAGLLGPRRRGRERDRAPASDRSGPAPFEPRALDPLASAGRCRALGRGPARAGLPE